MNLDFFYSHKSGGLYAELVVREFFWREMTLSRIIMKGFCNGNISFSIVGREFGMKIIKRRLYYES